MVVTYVNVYYKNVIFYGSLLKHEDIKLHHEIVFVLILYFIKAIISKKYQSEWLKKVKKGKVIFASRRGFSKEGRIKPYTQSIYKKIMKSKNLIYMFYNDS